MAFLDTMLNPLRFVDHPTGSFMGGEGSALASGPTLDFSVLSQATTTLTTLHTGNNEDNQCSSPPSTMGTAPGKPTLLGASDIEEILQKYSDDLQAPLSPLGQLEDFSRVLGSTVVQNEPPPAARSLTTQQGASSVNAVIGGGSVATSGASAAATGGIGSAAANMHSRSLLGSASLVSSMELFGEAGKPEEMWSEDILVRRAAVLAPTSDNPRCFDRVWSLPSAASGSKKSSAERSSSGSSSRSQKEGAAAAAGSGHRFSLVVEKGESKLIQITTSPEGPSPGDLDGTPGASVIPPPSSAPPTAVVPPPTSSERPPQLTVPKLNVGASSSAGSEASTPVSQVLTPGLAVPPSSPPQLGKKAEEALLAEQQDQSRKRQREGSDKGTSDPRAAKRPAPADSASSGTSSKDHTPKGGSAPPSQPTAPSSSAAQQKLKPPLPSQAAAAREEGRPHKAKAQEYYDLAAKANPDSTEKRYYKEASLIELLRSFSYFFKATEIYWRKDPANALLFHEDTARFVHSFKDRFTHYPKYYSIFLHCLVYAHSGPYRDACARLQRDKEKTGGYNKPPPTSSAPPNLEEGAKWLLDTAAILEKELPKLHKK